LGVEDLSNADAQGVKFDIDGLSETVSIIVGNNGTGDKNTQFVRRDGDKQTWLINKKLDLKRDVTQWLRKDLVDIPPERISKISIQHPGEELISIENKGDAEYEFVLLNSLPEGKKISESEVYQVANALSSLQVSDVALSDKVFKEVSTSVVTKFHTYDGLTITANTFSHDENSYSCFEIAFNAADVIEKEKISEDDAAFNSDPQAAEELAIALTKRIEKWAYVLPGISQDALVKKLDNFILVEQPTQ